MTNVSLLTAVINHKRKSEKPAKKSSLIKQWLGIDISQSLSIRIGNYLEEFFVQLVDDISILPDLQLRDGQRVIERDGEYHQVDLLVRIDDTIYHREIKCNLDLDRGKKRDVIYREECIVAALQEKYLDSDIDIDSGVFCPFLDTSREVSGLGKVEGLAEFIDTFNVDLTVDEFKELGRNEQIHRTLLK